MKVANEIKMIPIDQIKPYDKNPRKNSKTVELLVKILPKVGFNVPLVLDKDNVIVKGHARYLAAKQLEMPELPCIITDADPEAIKADRIADNKVFEFTIWDDEELLHELDMIDLDFDFADFGLPTTDISSFDFEIPDMDEELQQYDDEERRKRFLELLEQEAEEVHIVTEHEISAAKERQSGEAERGKQEFFSVECEKCGNTIFLRRGDERDWSEE